MATATNRAAIETALLSVRSLRRRKLGHISPTHYPNLGLDKWGRKHTNSNGNGNGNNNHNHNGNNTNGMPSNLLANMGASGGHNRRPAPRASLVFGGEGRSSIRRRNGNGGLMNGYNKQNGNNNNGNSNNNNTNNNGLKKNRSMYSNRLGMMGIQQLSANRYVNGSSSSSSSSSSQKRHAVINGGGHSHQLKNGNDRTMETTNASSDNATEQYKYKDKDGKYKSNLIVVLDMDECLIHSQFLSDVDKYRQVEDRPSSSVSSDDGSSSSSESSSAASSSSSSSSSFEPGGGHHNEHHDSLFLNACDSFRIHLPDNGDLVNVNKRPQLDTFLQEVTSKFETYIFTAAMEVYAEPVLNKLDPDGTMFSGRFYRDHCSYDEDLGVYAKDLCDVLRMRKMMMDVNDATMSLPLVEGGGGRQKKKHHVEEQEVATSLLGEKCKCNIDMESCGERRVVLVDNNPLSFLPNPSNGILVSSFYDDPKDDTLEAVMELLHELDESEDVRPILDDRFGLKDALEDVVKGASVGW